MADRLITPAAGLAVTLDDAKTNLRIDLDRTDLDVLVEAWIRGVTGHAEHYMNRSILHQVRQLTLPRFPSEIKLERSPLVAVGFVKYFDEANVERTLDPAAYQVATMLEPGAIMLQPGTRWPATYDRVDAVQVQYTCGYGDDPASTPPEFRLYILAKLLEMFDPVSSNAPPSVGKPYKVTFIDSMIEGQRVYL
jgi:uncharacterized phiE125 gp8 family phage protein